MDPALHDLNDHDLLLGGVHDRILASQAQARQWARLVEFHRRREADFKARQAADPHFALTARQATALEVSELWGISEQRARHQLNVALFLSSWLPQVWQWALSGQLDSYLATTIADQARHRLKGTIERWQFAERLTPYLQGRLRDLDGVALPVIDVTPKQVRNKLTYELNRIQSADAEARFRQKHADRGVHAREDDDGMASLTIAATTDQVERADHRLTLAAKELRAGGDERTLQQLKSDLAIDLLAGRSDGVPLPTYARPIINVTVPIQTLMGLSDDPATLSGGQVIPAGLARRIATEPGSTWYRMLTDDAGTMVALSTRSYTPTAPIWRQVVANQISCYRPHCERPATLCELDHVEPWPTGSTSTTNLQPACKTDHKAKHSPGFTLEQADNGSIRLSTPAGFTHDLLRTQHPASDHWPEVAEVQFSATELLAVLAELRDRRDLLLGEEQALEWEHGWARALSDLIPA
jgi:hypothetical protein